jgi:Protein of unknown function, DUF481
MNRTIIILVLSSSAWLQSHAQKKKDIVIMKNGDHLSGEVKKLNQGSLYIDLDYTAGSIAVDWTKVEKIETNEQFQITLENGDRSVGSIKKLPSTESPGQDFVIVAGDGEHKSASNRVVDIKSQEDNFWHQLTGAIDLGFNYTSGNNQTSLSSDASVNYLVTKWFTSANLTTSFSGQPNTSRTNLYDLQAQQGIFLNHNSYMLALQDFLHSSQQNLDLRSTLGGGYGHFLIRNLKSYLALTGGAVYTNELFTSTSQQGGQNIEGLVGVQYQLLEFDKYQLQAQAYVFPGLSDFGRVRATPKITFTVKLPNNFHTNFSFWDNYDSRPPASSKGNELGISNSLGWTF